MITASKLNKIFGRGAKAVHAVRDVDINVDRGERIFIHGPSGAGKSSLLHVLAGLNKPTSGSVEFCGKDIYNLSDRKRSSVRNESFGFIFQFYHLLKELNVLENVMLPAMISAKESSRNIRKKAISILENMAMKDRLKHKPSQLSGGEAQRVAIARALMNSTSVLFCDEPTGNLDSEMSKDIYKLIRNASEERNMSIIVVSHQAIDEDFAHNEYFMKDGILEKISTAAKEKEAGYELHQTKGS
jgi:lipoprotein-releasing system ATP-binding protein